MLIIGHLVLKFVKKVRLNYAHGILLTDSKTTPSIFVRDHKPSQRAVLTFKAYPCIFASGY